MDLYRKGHLTKVQRLGGGPAFNPEDITGLVSIDQLAAMAGDESEAVRQLDNTTTEVESLVNTWITERHPVRAVETTRAEAEALGAMALFGEKYGDWVRMVKMEGVSRELCGGTHVASTAEIGLFHLAHETSSASNVRRIEAVTGPVGIDEFRRRTDEELSDRVKQTLGDSAVVLGTAVDGRVHLVANVAPPAVERGVKAGEIVRVAAGIVGGGGGGRDTMAQAGGRNPDKLPEAVAAARLAIERALG